MGELQIAAKAAKIAGIITEREYQRLTDGTVSVQDYNRASKLVEALGEKPIRQAVAAALANAVSDQLDQQTDLRTIKETIGDFFKILGD